MLRRLNIIWFFVAASFSGAAQPVPAQTTRAAGPSSDNFTERYGILSEKNIFVRNRPPTRSISRGSGSSAPRRPEESFVVTGIALQEGRHVAFIEDRSTNVTRRVLPGETIAGGKVVSVEFDSLEFDSNGRTSRIGIGRNLLGDVFVAAAPAAAQGASAGGSTTGPSTAPAGAAAPGSPASPPLPDDPNLSLEERMKLRRQQISQ